MILINFFENGRGIICVFKVKEGFVMLNTVLMCRHVHVHWGWNPSSHVKKCLKMFTYNHRKQLIFYLLENISFAISGLISRLISCVDLSLEIGSALKTNEVVWIILQSKLKKNVSLTIFFKTFIWNRHFSSTTCSPPQTTLMQMRPVSGLLFTHPKDTTHGIK